MPTKSANNAIELSYVNYIASNNTLNFTATPISGGAPIVDATAGVYANGAFAQSNAAFNKANSAAILDANTTSNGFFSLPAGNTAQRPSSSANGHVRFNTTTGNPEWYNGATGTWLNFNQGASYLIEYSLVFLHSSVKRVLPT